MMRFIEYLRSQRLEQRRKILWATVGLAALSLIIVWFLTERESRSEFPNPPSEIRAEMRTLIDSIRNLRKI